MLVSSVGWRRAADRGFGWLFTLVAGLGAFASAWAWGAQDAAAPGADGTIADGDAFGPFDGVPDIADWSFNDSGFEGAITLSRRTTAFEYRVVFEYDLTVARTFPMVTATLTFKLRGGTRFPADPAPVQVVAYPADLVETLSDFNAGPGVIVATRSVPALQPTTTYTIAVVGPVTQAIASGARAIGFRFQIAPDATAEANQAFMDALDSDSTTKPVLTVRLPGDLDGDGDVDRLDFRLLRGCIKGPGVPPTPACVLADIEEDSDVDLRDVSIFFRSPAFVVTP